jgi:hypothetical protein
MPGIRKSLHVSPTESWIPHGAPYCLIHSLYQLLPSCGTANGNSPTAPDALEQVKKGLKGLFGRRKSHQPEATSSTTPAATETAKPDATTTAPPAAAPAPSADTAAGTGAAVDVKPAQPTKETAVVGMLRI